MRLERRAREVRHFVEFPFLFGGAFIEGLDPPMMARLPYGFPFLFGGAFIEGSVPKRQSGLHSSISLPFRRGFH